MFALTVTTIVITTVVVNTVVWRAHKRVTPRKAGEDKRVGRHRADERPTMTWRL